MNATVSNKAENNNVNIGFHSVQIEASQRVTIKRGATVKCDATFNVIDGVLHVFSQYDGVTLVLPQVALDTVEIDSEYDSVKCEGLHCNKLLISAAHNVKIETSIINECEISSEYDSVNVFKSTINTLNISAAQNVNVELDDFCYMEIESEYNGVKVIYNGNQLVNVDCASSFGSVKVNGPFYGGPECGKSIVISASQDIRLLGK